MIETSNTINVTKCDNQLILVAMGNWNAYTICSIKSGYHWPVNVTLNIKAGPAPTEILDLDGIKAGKDGLHVHQDITLPIDMDNGNYQLVAIGVEWGGDKAFSFTFNGTQYNKLNDNNGIGVVFSPAPIGFTVNQ